MPDRMQLGGPAPGNGARPGPTPNPSPGPGADALRVELPPPASPPPQRPSSDFALPQRSTAGSLPSGDGLRLEPPQAAPRRRLPELMLGIFLVAGCALAAVLLAAAGRERTPALVLANDVQRGQVITDGDLRTIYVGSDSDSELALVDPDDADQIVDRAALSDMRAGTLVTAEQFADPASVLGQGNATIGLSLEAGQLPSLTLAPGDRVVVVAGGGGVGGAADGTEGAEGVDSHEATVVSATELQNETGQQPRWRVTLALTEEGATNLARALTSNAQVQLVMVER